MAFPSLSGSRAVAVTTTLEMWIPPNLARHGIAIQGDASGNTLLIGFGATAPTALFPLATGMFQMQTPPADGIWLQSVGGPVSATILEW